MSIGALPLRVNCIRLKRLLKRLNFVAVVAKSSPKFRKVKPFICTIKFVRLHGKVTQPLDRTARRADLQ